MTEEGREGVLPDGIGIHFSEHGSEPLDLLCLAQGHNLCVNGHLFRNQLAYDAI